MQTTVYRGWINNKVILYRIENYIQYPMINHSNKEYKKNVCVCVCVCVYTKRNVIATQVQETQRVPNRIYPRQNTPKHILIKLTKIKHKEQLLKAAREKQQITHKGIPIRRTADLWIETLQARREWQDILRVMKENNLQPRLLYPARMSIRYEGELKSFTDKQKLKEFSTTKPALQQMLKDLL